MWTPEHVVQIGRLDGESYKSIGSGTLLSPMRVLTARHVVVREDGPKLNLAVRRGDCDWTPVKKVVWRGDGQVDAAILDIVEMAIRESHPLALLSARAIDLHEGWHARGFPVLSEGDRCPKLQSVTGTTHPWWRQDPKISVNVDCKPDNWPGMSGASIVVEGHILGVIAQAAESFDGKVLRAVPVCAFYSDPKFVDALGVADEHAAVCSMVAETKASLVRSLSSRRHLIKQIAREIGLEEMESHSAERLADDLLNRCRARSVAKGLNVLDSLILQKIRDLPSASEKDELELDRRLVQNMFWWSVRYAANWQPYVAMARRAFPPLMEHRRLPNSLELPFESQTITEVILAGADGRSPRFKPSSRREPPPGSSQLRLSALCSAPLFRTNDQIESESLEEHLALELADEKYKRRPDVPSSEFARKRRANIERNLMYTAYEARHEDRVPYYLLVDEQDLGDGEQAEARWVLLRETLGKNYPSLRIVRQLGIDNEDDGSTAKHIDAMVRNRIP